MPTSAPSTAFKDQIDTALVRRLGAVFGDAEPTFDVAAFRRRAGTGLAALELKARISHVAQALRTTLPEDVAAAVAVVDRVLAMPTRGDGTLPADLQGWDLWPVAEWVALAGRDRPNDALELLSRLTCHASGEFAIRPFIDDDPDGVLRRLHRWVERDDEHVRRLVSEGTRPKLPWAPKLAITASRPDYAVELLDLLVDDPSEYVRRSVSNHLNDLCRVDPELALGVAARWLADDTVDDGGADAPGGGAGRRDWVVRRGLRTLVKAGDPQALRLLGHDPDLSVAAELVVRTPTVTMGGTAEWELVLVSHDDKEHRVILDYAIHHVRADGTTGRKVAKWTTVTLSPGRRVELSRRHRIVPITTRTYYSGTHLVEIQVNGVVVATGSFDLQV